MPNDECLMTKEIRMTNDENRAEAAMRRLAMVMVGLLISCCWALSAGITKGPTVEGITEYQLDNGLRVLLYPDPSRATGTLNMDVLGGSRPEGNGEMGNAD